MFVSDIVDVVTNKIKLFSGDTCLYCIVDDEISATESLNQDLEYLNQWATTRQNSVWTMHGRVNQPAQT